MVDSGSTINVLLYKDGCELGLYWETQRVPLKDEGFLAGAPIYGVLLTVSLAPFSPIELAFAWTRKSRATVQLILGQVNFFEHFDITFQGREKTFKIIPAVSSS